MSLPPTSFRFPFQMPEDQDAKVHPMVAQAIRYAFSGILDLQNAIVSLNTKVEPAVKAAASTTSTASSGSSSFTVNVGGVNNLNNGTGTTSYSLTQSDFGALVNIASAVPFALTLNNGVTAPFYCVVENFGSALVTATPVTGQVNDEGTFLFEAGLSGLVYFDGSNWWITTLPAYLLGGSTGFGAVVLDSGATLISPTLNGTITIDSGSNVVFDSGAVMTNPTMRGVISLSGLPIYANNAAAVAGGLVPGNTYRTNADPDFVAVVH